MPDINLQAFEAVIGYQFRDRLILRTALTHSSYLSVSDAPTDNERMEFLGDAVLELCVSDYIFKHFTTSAEGAMTITRAGAVCEDALYLAAKKCELGKYIFMSPGEERSGGREKPSILSDTFEAVICAIYLDGGFDAAREFIYKYVIINAGAYERDAKSRLQELAQERKLGSVEYRVEESSGPAHKMHFVVSVYVDDKKCGTGEGRSKQDAGQNAAHFALKALRNK